MAAEKIEKVATGKDFTLLVSGEIKYSRKKKTEITQVHETKGLDILSIHFASLFSGITDHDCIIKFHKTMAS